MLETIINHLQNNKIPDIITKDWNKKQINQLYEFIKKTKFTLIHLTDQKEGKKNLQQNSRSWIKIEPLDVFIHNNVENFL